MFVIATAGGADASFTKGACVATRAAVLFAGRCVKTGTVTECEGLTVEFAGTGDAAFSFGTGCEAVSAMGIIVGEIETLSVAHRFVGQTVMRVFGATASDTGLIVETRGSARGVIVDATASDTGLIVETRGLTRCVVIDACAFDTGLVVETRGLTWDNRFDASASDTGLVVETRGLTRCVVIDACAFDTGLVVETRGLTWDNRFDATASDTGLIVETRGLTRGVIFDATASDTGLIIETRGLTRGVIFDATASDTGLVVDTCGLACIDVASADRFAAIGRIIVAVVVSQLTNACAVLAEHEIAADVATGTAIFAVAREIGADARGTKREICGTTDRAMAFFAGFIAFARGCTVTAVFGVALEIDTASVAPVLVGRTSV